MQHGSRSGSNRGTGVHTVQYKSTCGLIDVLMGTEVAYSVETPLPSIHVVLLRIEVRLPLRSNTGLWFQKLVSLFLRSKIYIGRILNSKFITLSLNNSQLVYPWTPRTRLSISDNLGNRQFYNKGRLYIILWRKPGLSRQEKIISMDARCQTIRNNFFLFFIIFRDFLLAFTCT